MTEITLSSVYIYLLTIFTIIYLRNSTFLPIVLFTLFGHLYYLVSCLVFDFGYFVPIFSNFSGKQEYYFVASLCLMYTSLGIVHGATLKYRTTTISRPVKTSSILLSNNPNIMHNRIMSIVAVALVLTSYFLVLMDVKFTDLLYRDVTFVEVTGGKMSTVDILFWPLCVLISALQNRNLRHSLLLIYFCLYFGMGERQAFLLLFTYGCFRKFFFTQSNIKFASILLSSFVVLSLLIFARYGERSAGIIGVLSHLQNIEEIIQFILFSINYVTNFSVFTNGEAILAFDEDPGLVLYSLNPLPSFLLNDEMYSGSIDLQPHVPYAGAAMIYNTFGFFGNYIVGTFIGLLISITSRYSRQTGLPRPLILILALAPLIFMTQYNLRAGIRFFYYMIVFTLVGFTVIKFRWKKGT